MRLTSLSLLLVFALAAALPAQEGPKVPLEWKFKKGDQLRYEAGQVIEMDIAGTEVTIQMLFGLAMEVTDVSAEGAAKLKVTYDRVKVSMNLPAPSDYDSDKEKKPAEGDMMGQLFSGFVDKSFSMDLTKKGECTKVEGLSKIVADASKDISDDNPMAAQMKQNMGKQFGDEGMKSVFQLFMGFIPKEPVAVGATWNVKHTLGGALGKVALDATNTLKELRAEGKEAVIKMEAKVTVSPGDGGGPFGAMEISESKMKSEVIWKVEEGLLQSSAGTLTLDGSAGGMDFSIVQKMTMKLAPRTKK